MERKDSWVERGVLVDFEDTLISESAWSQFTYDMRIYILDTVTDLKIVTPTGAVKIEEYE